MAQAIGYGSVQFTEPLNLSSPPMGRYSAMLIPQSGGLNNAAFDNADVPLNAKLAFNPNTNQLIVVPTVPLGNDVYLFSLSNIQATNGDQLLNNNGQFAGKNGAAPYFASFGLSTGLTAQRGLPVEPLGP